ncbi:putative 8-oxoguanine DNA glycosylase [Trypanosoma vivax]|nr:putative 8-oxoguanine DNA glycosylase [Trypanosoma vivax]
MTLCGGQCFRWRRTPRGTYVGVVRRIAYELANFSSCHTLPFQKDCHDSTPGFVVPAGVGSVKDEGDVPSGCLWFRCLNCELRDSSEVESQAVFLRHYLAVDVDLEKMWEQWTAENPMRGHPLVRYLTLHSSLKLPVKIRHLRQELHETLFAFLCSQNNNVQRITSLIERLSLKYGDHLCDYNLETGDVRCFDHVCKLHRKRAARCGQEAAEERNQWIALHVLPTVEQLSAATEDELRSLGFGYRSKYIIGCTNVIRQSGVVGREVLSEHCRGATKFSESTVVPSYRWYEELLSPNCTLEERRAKLLTLPGVGRKVADCVLLFGLGHHELVPVDTHMAQVAAEYLASSGGAGSYGRREGWRLKGGKRARVNDSRSRLRGVNDIEENQRGDSTWEAVVAGWRMGNGEGKNKLPPLLPKHHDAIQVGFRSLFGEYCGWAHSILFYARMRTGAAAMNRLAEGAVSV